MKDARMLLGEEVNGSDAFKTMSFTESFQNVKRRSHANRSILGACKKKKNAAERYLFGSYD